MNKELLKTLMNKAMEPSGLEGLGGPYMELNQEKFAELIVQECIKSIQKTIDTDCDTDSEKMGCEYSITNLIEYFEVK